MTVRLGRVIGHAWLGHGNPGINREKENTMATKSLLAGLALVDAKKPVNAGAKQEPIVKFLEGVVRQIGYVNDEKAGKALVTEGSKKPRLWHWKKTGTYFVSVYYGTAPLDLGNGMNTIQAGKSLDDVLKVLETIKAAGEAGELTDKVNAAAEVVSARLGGKGGRKRKTA